MTNENAYQYLGPRPGSLYRQYFIKGTGIFAESIYRAVIGPEQMTPEEAARNWNLPLEAVRECITYCERSAALLQQEREEDDADLARRRELNPEMYPLPPRSSHETVT